MSAASMYNEGYASFQKNNGWIGLIAIATIFVTLICMLCCGVGRRVPYNYIGLLLFTMGEGYLVSLAVADYSHDTVYAAALMTCCVTIGLTVYAWTTKKDFTIYGGILFILIFALIGMGIASILTRNRLLYNFYSFLGVVFYGFYLIYDTQLIMQTKKYRYDSDDYIIAAI
jgi:hypothetical protein